jgi:AraC family transcriptional activator of pobA
MAGEPGSAGRAGALSMPRAADRGGVPAFALFGEESAVDDLEFVHIEDIADRSRRYQWEIASHTHRGLLQIIVVLSGGARADLDDLRIDVAPPAAIVVPPSVIHAFRFRADTRGKVLTVAERLMDGAGVAEAGLLEPLRRGPVVVALREGQGAARERVPAMLHEIAAEFAHPAAGRRSMLEWLVGALLVLLGREAAAGVGPGLGTTAPAAAFAHFRELVESHFVLHRPVAWFAARVGVTETTLNRLCRRQAGRTAFDLVQQRLLLEARRKLVYTAMPVSQLAYALGFSDPAYFCRFFSRRTGMAPTTFRRRVMQQGAGG